MLRCLNSAGGHFTGFADGRQFGLFKPSDIPNLLNEGIVDVGFVGSDKWQEACLTGQWPNLRAELVASADCEMVVASSVPMNEDSRLNVATSYPATVLAKTPYSVGYIAAGSVEAYPSFMEEITGIVDIRQTGDSLRDNGFDTYKPLFNVGVLAVERSGIQQQYFDPSRLYMALNRITASKRRAGNPSLDQTYTSTLFVDTNEIVKKFGSESAEFLQEFCDTSGTRPDEWLMSEATDLIYALSVALESRDMRLIDCLAQLAGRGQSNT